MIRLEALDEKTIEIRPEVRLGTSWGPYQAAIKAAGARNRKVDGVWQTTAPIENASEIEMAVRHLGLPVSIGPGLAACRDANEDPSAGLSDGETFVAELEAASGIKLFDYQRQGVSWLRGKSRGLLLDEMGCVDGEAKVRINRAGKSFEITLEQLFFRFNGRRDVAYQHGRAWDPKIPTTIRALCDGVFRQHPIKAVLDKGVRPVLRIVTDGGKSLRVTADHEVCVRSGEFCRADELRPGDEVLTNGRLACRRCGSSAGVVVDPYKRFRGFCRKCIYRHLRKKPTWKGGRSIDVMEQFLGRPIGRDEVIHHKRGKTNNSIDNLVLTTVSEHAAHHGRQGGFVRLDGARSAKGGFVCFVPKVDRVASVEPDGVARVYDVVCEDPHRNFVANGIVIHNCGKTLQVLAAVPEGVRMIVVCPAAVKAVWAREAARFRPELDVSVCKGRGSFRWPEPGEIVILNFELLPEIVPEGCPRDLVLVSDESHAFKSFKAIRTQRFRALGKAVRERGGKTWLLTGTPLTNRPPDLWGVLQAAGLAEATFGSWPFFAECFGGYQQYVTATQKVWVWGTPRSEEVAGRLRAVSLRRHKADVLTDLPAKRYEVLTETELRARDRKALDRVWAEIEAAGLGADEETGKKKLPAFERMSEARAIIARAKLPLLDAIVEAHEDAQEPLVVFSAHKAPVEEIGRRPGWGLLTGDVSAEERAVLVNDFQIGKLKGLACTIQAAGVGLTMTAASHVVFVDLDWTPALNAQAEDRLHRIGQTQPVLVTVLSIDHPLEARIIELCTWKKGIFEATVGASSSYRATVPTAEEVAKRDEEKKTRKPRPPEGPVETWAAAALSTLSGMDPDDAKEQNTAGWNRIDGPFGHRLSAQLWRGLSDGQWAAAIRMCKKYHRQVGRCPEEQAQGASREAPASE